MVPFISIDVVININIGSYAVTRYKEIRDTPRLDRSFVFYQHMVLFYIYELFLSSYFEMETCLSSFSNLMVFMHFANYEMIVCSRFDIIDLFVYEPIFLKAILNKIRKISMTAIGLVSIEFRAITLCKPATWSERLSCLCDKLGVFCDCFTTVLGKIVGSVS